MSVIADIAATWAAPRRAMRRQLAGGVREDRALVVLIAACLLLFVAQWPVAARLAHLEPDLPLAARLTGAMFSMLFILPLVAYALAALVHLVARVLGGRGSFWRARMALFWALLAIAPAQMALGLVTALVGPGALTPTLGLAVFAGFMLIWGAGIAVAEYEVAKPESEAADAG